MGIKGREVVREPPFLMEFDCVCVMCIFVLWLSVSHRTIWTFGADDYVFVLFMTDEC